MAGGEVCTPLCSKFEALELDNDDDKDFSFPEYCTQLDLGIMDQLTPETTTYTFLDLPSYVGSENIFEEWEKIFEEINQRLLQESLHKLDLQKDSGCAKKRIAPQGQSGTRKKPRSKHLAVMNQEYFRGDLLVDCARDLRILFGHLDFAAGVTKSFPVDQKPPALSVEAQKVSNLYGVLTWAGNEAEMSAAVFEALIDLCRLDNDVILYRSLRVLNRALTGVYPLDAGSNTGVGDNIIIEGPSSGENTAETRVRDDVKVEGSSSEKNTEKSYGLQSDEIALPKFGLDCIAVFELMSQIATRKTEESIRLEAVSIMDLLLGRSKAYGIDRERLRRVLGYQTISQFLQKDSGVDVQTAEGSREAAIPTY